jgi:hypothetical protein
MVSAKAAVELDVPAEELWQVIGGFGSLPDWLPFIADSRITDGGRVRHLSTADGQHLVERLEKYDHADRSYSYSIVHAPFHITDYLSTIRVTSVNGSARSHVEWFGTFEPEGASDETAHDLVQGIISGGLKALAERYNKDI